jgi:hypothetical protein
LITVGLQNILFYGILDIADVPKGVLYAFKEGKNYVPMCLKRRRQGKNYAPFLLRDGIRRKNHGKYYCGKEYCGRKRNQDRA